MQTGSKIDHSDFSHYPRLLKSRLSVYIFEPGHQYAAQGALELPSAGITGVGLLCAWKKSLCCLALPSKEPTRAPLSQCRILSLALWSLPSSFLSIFSGLINFSCFLTARSRAFPKLQNEMPTLTFSCTPTLKESISSLLLSSLPQEKPLHLFMDNVLELTLPE